MLKRKNEIAIVVIAFLILFFVSQFASDAPHEYPKLLEIPWDHTPITVFVDDVNVPQHYSPTYRVQVEYALLYWETGGNLKLDFIPDFEIVDTDDADISIMWVENLEEVTGADEGVAGFCISYEVNGTYEHADIVLEVGNYQGYSWRQYGDRNMLLITKHELGHALGLAHSNDRKDIMYPAYEEMDDVNPLLLNATRPFLLVFGVGSLVVIGFLLVNWRRYKRKREHLEMELFGGDGV
ncbi:MAG TPA: matrixin family metalloprotease [Methanosarcinaceae archaeon]|nr:matrixin family metalloprotease [Methanosarcinaceae archaeon]